MGVINCPNLRYKETKKGGFLGFGAEGCYYCSLNPGNELNRGFMNERCQGKRIAKQGDDPRYSTTYSSGTNYASGFLDCPQYTHAGVLSGPVSTLFSSKGAAFFQKTPPPFLI